ncbi:hypothetical protein R6Q59_029455 [Mikania micrantha]
MNHIAEPVGLYYTWTNLEYTPSSHEPSTSDSPNLRTPVMNEPLDHGTTSHHRRFGNFPPPPSCGSGEPELRLELPSAAPFCAPQIRDSNAPRHHRFELPPLSRLLRDRLPEPITALPDLSYSGVVNAELFFPFAITVKMRNLAAQISFYLCRRKPVNVRSRPFSSSSHERGFPDERAMEEEAERKIGWLFKLIFAGTATIVGYNIFPYLGDNLIQQSVSLLDVKDPLFKRMGASRLTRFATDDERRMKIVEMGGAQKLVEMLGAAKDDPTRKEALNAIVAIAHSDEAAGALHSAGAISVIMDTKSAEDEEIEKYKEKLLKRFRGIKQV